MSDPIDVPAGQVLFRDSYQPGLRDGVYKIKVSHSVSAPDVTVPDLFQQFKVAGPRFSIDPSDVHVEFPPNASSSQFAEVLPHVVLNKRLLPWERNIKGLSESVPWLTLLAFQEGELIGDKTDTKTVIANYAQTITVEKLIANASSTIRTPQFGSETVSDDEKKMNCRVITISNETFARIVPTARELPFLAHAREVDTSAKASLDMKDRGVFSVVVANRFPLPGDATYGAKTIVHLVSLEGFGDLLGGVAPVQPPQTQVQFVSLLSWTYSCLADPAQKFSGLAQNLAYDADNKLRPADSLVLRLPFTPSTANDPATVSAQLRLSDGYVALGYHAQTGEDGFAWYRGPFAPVVSKLVPNAARPFETGAAAMIYDPKTGVFDHSLAAAWQCGRGLALADQAYAMALMRLRRKANAHLDQMVTQETVTPRDPQEVIHAQFAALIARNAVETIRGASNADDLPKSERKVKAAAARAPVTMLREFMTRPDVKAAMAQQVSDDPDAQFVANWLGHLQLLYGVPFVHLVADERMLPNESIRFFYFDQNWIGALTDGAMHVGLGSSKESAAQRALTQRLEQMAAAAALAYRAKSLKQPPPAPVAGPHAGLLIRSALVSGWPGVVVNGTAAGKPVTSLRVDHLAPNVLFCLFNGVPDAVTLAEPHEGLEFGTDDQGKITTRVVTPPKVKDGAAVTIYDPQNPGASMATLRTGGMRVLNVNTDPNFPTATAPASPTDLLGTIAKTLNVGTGSIGPADFAVQMVKGPEEITFSFDPPAKP
jgi:hypothetical protein